MAKISFIRPLDQPLGTRRLLSDLVSILGSKKYDDLKIIVAYAKTGPLYRLYPYLDRWHKLGKKANVIFGIDQQGTSYEALKFSLQLFDNVYITKENTVTFHPKMYIFSNNNNIRALIGSNNLTIGGTETNFESAVDIELDINTENKTVNELLQSWNELLPENCPATDIVTESLLEELLSDEYIIKENILNKKNANSKSNNIKVKRLNRLHIKPRSILPDNIKDLIKPQNIISNLNGTKNNSIIITGFAIQIKPHHNGEIFLSVKAVQEHPDFFGWPFKGKTTPKKAGNPSYPQRIPDPIVNIYVYGKNPEPLLILNSYNLNTIYYTKKSEIRITASPLVPVVPDYSIMIIENTDIIGIDYNITIYTPENKLFNDWIAVCNYQMPGGGKKPRKYGWF
jgi:HKD family nuclease